MIGGLVLGFVGSLHCLGMCGPLTMLFMYRGLSVQSFLLYHFARITTYGALGAILGLVGFSLQLFQLQQVLTIAIGLGLLILYGIPSLRNQLEAAYYKSKFYKSVNGRIRNGLSNDNNIGWGKYLVAGVSNGLLPCGLTYVAVAAATAVGGVWAAVLFMVFFGLGTFPALILVSFGRNILSKSGIKSYAIPVVAILSGIILITRGLLLTIPEFNQVVKTNAEPVFTICGLN